MPHAVIDKFADKIKQRKKFKDIKDKKKSALNYVDKKWKEAEAIVKKQYGGPDKIPEGKYYGTLMIILKNKLHLKESKFDMLYEEFIDGIKVNGDYIEIFKNPNKSELKELSSQEVG